MIQWFRRQRKSVQRVGVAGILLSGGLIAAACNSGAAPQTANNKTQKTSASSLNQFEQAQPVPKFSWSQLRQDLINIEQAQANGAQTTTFFFNQGVQSPVQSCPSIGFPVASTTELTNPLQPTWTGNTRAIAGVAIGQLTPNGVYAGNSTGTYVVCVGAAGKPFIDYWEGFVQTVGGPAAWTTSSHTVKQTGPASVPIQVGKTG